jgi:dipeptidase
VYCLHQVKPIMLHAMLKLSFVAAAITGAEACTTLIAGKLATTDGSVMASHSDDGESNTDARLIRVPAQNHGPTATRPIFYDVEDFPRYVGTERGDIPQYAPLPNQTAYKAIGSIPELAHTFAYYEATYGIINEHSVGIGESTCSAIFGAKAVGHGGAALLSVDALSKVAMERATTSREAVQLMGQLAEQHGFYGAGAFEGTGESLMVIDPREGFIFHILPDDTGKSAVWVAQRVPDDEVGVVANMFTIRKVDFSDTKNFLGSASVHSIALKKGLWKPADGLLDFTKVYSDGEYAHKYYSGRRMWGAYRIFNPSGKGLPGGSPLPADYDDLRATIVYPATLKPDHLTGPAEFMAIHRDYYQGTPFDMTTGVAAGPWGDPDRYSTNSQKVAGNWERSIGLYRTGETHIVTANAGLPEGVNGVVYYAPHASSTAVFTPFFAGCALQPTSDQAVHTSFSVMDPKNMSRDSAFWAFKYVFNVAKVKYSYMMHDIAAKQKALEGRSISLVGELSHGGSMDHSCFLLQENAALVTKTWWKLPDELIFKYADGWLNDEQGLGYPDAWLKETNYSKGPPPVPHLGNGD